MFTVCFFLIKGIIMSRNHDNEAADPDAVYCGRMLVFYRTEQQNEWTAEVITVWVCIKCAAIWTSQQNNKVLGMVMY